jgi:hypothetical protein
MRYHRTHHTHGRQHFLWRHVAIVFRAKGKVVNLVLMIPGKGVPKGSMLALATYAISKPVDTLKDPP